MLFIFVQCGLVCCFARNFPAYYVSTCFTDVVPPHIGFTDGACCSTQNLSSTAWGIYDPHGELIGLQGICLGRTTNNITEYSVVIKFLSEAITLGIWELVVNLDS